ncbi:hypothetical protein DRQ53_04955 [bacterium]|nr:MAG: hypothetical protein DRQ53_04955 [bacterium]
MKPGVTGLALLACLASLAASLPAPAGLVSPLRGVGELAFTADMPVFFDDHGSSHVHLAARVFERDLVRPASGVTKRLSLHMKLARAGFTAVDTVATIEFVSSDLADLGAGSWTEPFRLIEIRSPIEPGTWAVTLELRDRDGGTAVATGVLEVGPALAPRLSDPEFQLSTRNGTLPWPDRVYGINQDTLEVYFEVEGLTGPQTFRFEVHDPRYGLLDDQNLTLDLQSGRSATLWKLPVGDYPEGSYGLRIVPPFAAEEMPMKEFSISWRIDRALEGGDELLVESELAMLPKDHDRLLRLSRARQIELLQEFWNIVDPTPGSERNETRDKFVARIEDANRIYQSRRGPGALSDRGRVYVQFGRPREVDVEVMPRNGDELEIAIQSLHDIYSPEVEGVMARGDIYGDIGTGPRTTPINLPGAHAQGATTDFSSETASDLRRNAARVGREGGFEVWKYEYNGEPLLAHHRPGLAEQQHIRFIFVDRRGVGDFRLEYSNLPTRR